MGDPVRTLLAAAQNDVIREEGLIECAVSVGDYFKAKMALIGMEFPNWVTNVRGLGLCLAFDVPNDDLVGTRRNHLVGQLKKRGVNVPVCGAYTVRARPCLYFEEKHVDVYIEVLRETL